MDERFHERDHAEIDNPEVAHETSDVNVRAIVWFGASLVVVAIVVHVLIWLLFDLFGGLNAATYSRQFPLMQTGEMRMPVEPRLQERPREDLKALRRLEDETLNGYTWLNKATGAVRIPIDEAMKQVVEQGFPVVEDPLPPQVIPQDSSSGRTPVPAAKR